MASSDTEDKAGASDEEEVKLKSTDGYIEIAILHPPMPFSISYETYV